MLRIALFCVYAPFAALEIFYQHHFGLIVVGSLYAGLSLQADFAARKYLARAQAAPRGESNGAAETEELKVAPLGERKTKPPAPERPEPNFEGRAHEVLGVAENAGTRTIVRAFRHWIKRFHPDTARHLPKALANAQGRKLAEAKRQMLEQRGLKKAS